MNHLRVSVCLWMTEIPTDVEVYNIGSWSVYVWSVYHDGCININLSRGALVEE